MDTGSDASRIFSQSLSELWLRAGPKKGAPVGIWGWILTKAQAHLPAYQDAPTRQLRNSDSPKKLRTRFHFWARAANSCASLILGRDAGIAV